METVGSGVRFVLRSRFDDRDGQQHLEVEVNRDRTAKEERKLCNMIERKTKVFGKFFVGMSCESSRFFLFQYESDSN